MNVVLDGSTNAQIMLGMFNAAEVNNLRVLNFGTPLTTYNAFIVTNAERIENLVSSIHVAKLTQALPIGETLGSLEILRRTCLEPKYLSYYFLYNDGISKYVVALSRQTGDTGTLWMFTHKEVDEHTNASDYILMSSVWGSDSWIQTIGVPPYDVDLKRVSVGYSFSNTRTYVFKDARSKYIVYSSDPGTVAAPQNTQVRPVVDPATAPPPSMIVPAVHFQAASSNTQTVLSNDSILAALKLDVRRYLETHSSNPANKTWYPYKVHGVQALNKYGSPVLFNDGKRVDAQNGSVTKVENSGIDKISQIAGIRDAILENSTQNSVDILSEIFSNSSSTYRGPARSYVVFQVDSTRGSKWNVVGTYTNVHIHIAGAYEHEPKPTSIDTALVDRSIDQGSPESVQFPSTPQMPAIGIIGSVEQTTQVTSTMNTQQQQPPPPQQQPQVQQQLPIQVLQQVSQQVQPAVPASVPAPSTMPYSVVPPVVPAPPATFPNFQANQGAASCPDGSPCFTWKFTGWKPAGGVNTSANTTVLPGNLEFRISRLQMEQLGSVANDTGYTLSFKSNQSTQSTKYPTYIQITSNTSSSSYSLVAIRPDVSGLENANKDPHCDAVWITTTGDFVRCKLEVTDVGNLVPGIYLEWAVPHIDTGRYVKEVNEVNTGSDPNLPYTYDPAAATAMNHGRGLFPDSVVASYAQGSIAPNDLILHRIDGATKYQDTYIIAAYTEPTNSRGGGVPPNKAAELGYTAHLDKIRRSYTGLKTTNSEYFDGDRYKTNPHFRFIPPWFEGDASPSILCIGDSLTSTKWHCTIDDKDPPAYYSTLLERLLRDVGIPATVEPHGDPGSRIWRHSPKVVTFPDGTTATLANWVTDPKKNVKLQTKYTLSVIWLGTNDLYFLNDRHKDAQGASYSHDEIKEQLKEDFVSVMQRYPAKNYLLVKVDGARNNYQSTSGCEISGSGTIDTSTCKRTHDREANMLNSALEDLEQLYSNVHVTTIDYGIERCPSESTTGYIHFRQKEGIAKSIFGRIMCHAIFHRDSGDLRWVGAVPATKQQGARTTVSIK